MKNKWQKVGLLSFWLGWPLLFIYLYNKDRTRIIIEHDGQILVVRGWLGDGKWALPGGGLHRHESPLVSAVRELREETTIVIKPKELHYIDTIKLRNHGFRVTLHCYYVQLTTRPTTQPQRGEILAIDWLSQQQLKDEQISSDETRAVMALWHKRRRGAKT